MGINYQPQLVSWISESSTMGLLLKGSKSFWVFFWGFFWGNEFQKKDVTPTKGVYDFWGGHTVFVGWGSFLRYILLKFKQIYVAQL